MSPIEVVRCEKRMAGFVDWLGRKGKGIGSIAVIVGFLVFPVNGTSRAQTIEETLATLGKDRMLGSKAAPASIVEFSDKLFATDPGLGFTHPNLKQFALQVKLNPAKFGQCLDSGRYRRKVEAETAAAASLGARSTPTFFVNNRLLVGAQPFDVFRTINRRGPR